MRKENVLSTLAVALLVFGCASPMTSTPLPVASQIPTVTPSFIALPTATRLPEIPTITPESPLRTKGPYFAYFRAVSGIYQLVMMDADGRGKRVIELPQEYDPSIDLVSPDGKWLAFYTGSAGDPRELLAYGTFDLTLNLLNLETGEKQIVTSLLSKDYPDNFRKAAKQLKDPNITPESLQEAFLNGITHSIEWSPDGQHLAFAGQMDGSSSDLYIYDVQTKAIRRLSSGDQELQWINWSPDGKWILHGSVIWVGEGMTFDIYAAAADGSSIHEFPSGHVGPWLNSHEFFEHESANGAGDYGLRLVDIETGKVTNIWDGSFEVYNVSRSGKWLTLAALTSVRLSLNQEDPPGFTPGWQLINLKTLQKKRAPDSLSGPPDIFLQTEDGEVVPLEFGYMGDKRVLSSPDDQYWAVLTHEEIEIFSQNLDLVMKAAVPAQDIKIRDVVWRPDSSGLFLISGTAIYSVNISDGIINLVEANLLEYHGSNYMWINN